MRGLKQGRLKASFIALGNWETDGKINSFLNGLEKPITKKGCWW